MPTNFLTAIITDGLMLFNTTDSSYQLIIACIRDGHILLLVFNQQYNLVDIIGVLPLQYTEQGILNLFNGTLPTNIIIFSWNIDLMIFEPMAVPNISIVDIVYMDYGLPVNHIIEYPLGHRQFTLALINRHVYLDNLGQHITNVNPPTAASYEYAISIYNAVTYGNDYDAE
jgi:hypothetical protein